MWNLLIAGALTMSAVNVSVQSISGESVAGTLQEISPEKLVLQTDAGPKSFDLRELLAVTPDSDVEASVDEPRAWVELVDGSYLIATDYTVSKRVAQLELLGQAKLEVSTRSIRSVRFRPPSDAVQEQWSQILDAKAAGDVIVVRKTPMSLDELAGVLHEVTDETVEFEFGGDRIPVRREKLEGLVYFHPAGRELPDPVCQVSDVHGSKWQVKSLQLDGEEVAMISAAGVKSRLPLSHVKQIDFSAGNIVYLSDLKPESVVWTPFLESRVLGAKLFRMYQPQRDAGFGGEELRLGNRAYAKGLAIHSRTLLVFRLTEGFRRLRATAGIDDRLGGSGNVELVISGDGRELLRKSISGKDQPLPLDLDVTGVRRLQILVDFGEGLDIADHLNLCMARITK